MTKETKQDVFDEVLDAFDPMCGRRLEDKDDQN